MSVLLPYFNIYQYIPNIEYQAADHGRHQAPYPDAVGGYVGQLAKTFKVLLAP